MTRALPILYLAVSVSLAGESRDVLAFVETSCTGCHNPKVKAGDLDLKAFEKPLTFSENREVWERVLEKLKTGQMPPPAVPQPPRQPLRLSPTGCNPNLRDRTD